MKNKPLTKKQRKDLIDAWASLNILCAYYGDVKNGTLNFTDKFDPHEETRRIYRLIDSVIIKIDDSDL